MRLFIEFTNINMYEIIENGDYILTIGQPVPHMVADPNQLERERERATLLLCIAGEGVSILIYTCSVGLKRCVVHL